MNAETGGAEPVTWCRVFMQRICLHPCVDCKRADANYTDDERDQLLAPYRAALTEAEDSCGPAEVDEHNINDPRCDYAPDTKEITCPS